MAELPELVITGIAAVSPFGIGAGPLGEGLASGKPAFSSLRLFSSSFPPGVAAMVEPFEPGKLLGKGIRLMDRTSLLLLSAIALDLRKTIDSMDKSRLGLVLGTGFGSVHAISSFDRTRLLEGPDGVEPGLFPNTVFNCPASQANIRFGITGLTSTISNGFTAGIDALAYARSAILWGRADAVVAGGADELCEEIYTGFSRCGLMSPSGKCAPLSPGHDGLLMGEGAAMALLETAQAAERAGRRPLARLSGLAQRSSPITSYSAGPLVEATVEAVNDALGQAGAAAGEVDAIFAGANGVPQIDDVEAAAFRSLWGEKVPPVTAVKGLIGESYGAGAALQTAAAVLALRGAQGRQVRVALVTSMDLHGRASCAVLRAPALASQVA
ncbi:MAG: hypothetical protein HYZ28_18270 [Myxococcales bacterium]|nr:hypothetical protein [Myxococcales bacterium]